SSAEKGAPLHFSQPVGGVAEGHGTGTPTGNAEPSPKPTFCGLRFLMSAKLFVKSETLITWFY
uniref:hypothetical protein n=1 Tax=Escherichia coli TaxID=562 RepID=UPI003CD0095D